MLAGSFSFFIFDKVCGISGHAVIGNITVWFLYVADCVSHTPAAESSKVTRLSDPKLPCNTECPGQEMQVTTHTTWLTGARAQARVSDGGAGIAFSLIA